MTEFLDNFTSSDKIIQFLLEPQFIGWLAFLRVAFFVFFLILLGFIIFFLLKTTWLKRLYLWDFQEFFTKRPLGVRKIIKDWLKVRKRLDSGLESEYKLAIIEADSTLDDTLKRMGFDGQALGERLDKVTEATLPNMGDIRQAHDIRNNIVHDPNYRVTLDVASKTIAIFEKSLSDLQML